MKKGSLIFTLFFFTMAFTRVAFEVITSGYRPSVEVLLTLIMVLQIITIQALLLKDK